MFVGIDIGGTKIKYALVDEAGQTSLKGLIDTPLEREPLLQVLEGIVSRFQKETLLRGIGVSAPGVVRKDGYMLTGGAIPGLEGLALKDYLKTKFNLPVFVENDGKAAAIAEKWLGNAQDVDNYICVVLGTGVGGGIVLDGQVLRGMTGAAGEFSWMLTQNSQNMKEISSYLAGHMGVLLGLCERYNIKEKALEPDFVPTRSALTIFEQEAENPRAAEAIREYIQEVARGLFNFSCIFNPEKILLGGGISANQGFIEGVQQTFQELFSRHLMVAGIQKELMPVVEVAGLKNDAGLLGAVYQLLQNESQESIDL
ncbi:ROK family protein [Streptococcus mitis]|uniref:ROK family protein n=1 Tax=Streptococcus mitis TaxID=28037 RepID=UPI001CBC013C|nr:ROK family protein [Streptococcus mitis]MBZ2099200.1 ROK family protein [Streptococcus mitis]MBZ2104943.1 ROK family protein [Streptococcus mitis]MBZ2108479.1 ROK family protein [Streptococcus mitis]